MKLDKRNQMIQELVDDMHNWDPANLLDWAKVTRRGILSDLNDAELCRSYEEVFGDKSNGHD